jgi:hypothetical protein
MPTEDVITRVAVENPVAPERTTGADDPAATHIRQMVQDRATHESSQGHGARRSRLTVLAALAPAAVVVALVAVVVGLGHHAHRRPPSHPSPAPPVAQRLTTVFDRHLVTPGAVSDLVAGYGSLWALASGRVLSLDPHTGKTLRTFRTPGSGENARIAVGDGAVWATEGNSTVAGGRVYRISPRTHTAQIFASLKGIAFGLTVTRNAVWVATLDGQGAHLFAIDPRSGVVRPKVLQLPGSTVGLVHGAGYVWAQVTEPGLTTRVDPATGANRSIEVSGSLRWARASLWVTSQGAIDRVNPSTMAVTRAILVPRAVATAFAGGSAWTLSSPRSRSQRLFEPIRGTARLHQVDLRAGHTVGPANKVNMENPTNIAGAKNMLWILDYQAQELTGLRVR